MTKDKRPLDETEKRFCEKSIKKFDEGRMELEDELQFQQLLHEKIHRLNYKKKMRDTEKRIREINKELANIQEHVAIMQDQLRNGVEVKE